MSDLREKLTTGNLPKATPEALRALLKRHGLTGSAGAAILEVDGRTIAGLEAPARRPGGSLNTD